jgi:predicted acetyltransferase
MIQGGGVMEIRQLRMDDFDERVALSQFAFQFRLSAEEIAERKQTFRPEDGWGVFDEQGHMLSGLFLIPFETWIQGKKFAMGGIAGVATWPETRRHGYVSRLLVQTLETMRDNGQTISMLHPFSFPFYRKYGWEMTADRKQYTINTAQLPPRTDTPGQVVRIGKPDIALLDRVYSAYASRYSGTLVREPDWWERKIITKKGIFAVYYNEDDEAQGYVSYQVEDRKLTIHELVSTNEVSRQALWSYIGNHDSMIDQLTITVAIDDPLPLLIPDPRITQEIIPYFMSRIVDAQAFIAMYPFAAADAEEEVTLSLTDQHAEWNNGTYRLKFTRDGSAGLERLPQQQHEAGITCDIQSLTAMLAGDRKPSLLYETGRIRGEQGSIAILDRRIPRRTTHLMDFF